MCRLSRVKRAAARGRARLPEVSKCGWGEHVPAAEGGSGLEVRNAAAQPALLLRAALCYAEG